MEIRENTVYNNNKKSQISYNNAYEEKISEVFNGEKDAKGYYYSNSLPFINVETLDIIYCKKN